MADDPVASGPDPVATSEKQESNLRHQQGASPQNDCRRCRRSLHRRLPGC